MASPFKKRYQTIARTASPSRSRVGPALYVFSLLGLVSKGTLSRCKVMNSGAAAHWTV
jgi:hypothetical protein